MRLTLTALAAWSFFVASCNLLPAGDVLGGGWITNQSDSTVYATVGGVTEVVGPQAKGRLDRWEAGSEVALAGPDCRAIGANTTQGDMLIVIVRPDLRVAFDDSGGIDQYIPPSAERATFPVAHDCTASPT